MGWRVDFENLATVGKFCGLSQWHPHVHLTLVNEMLPNLAHVLVNDGLHPRPAYTTDLYIYRVTEKLR